MPQNQVACSCAAASARALSRRPKPGSGRGWACSRLGMFADGGLPAALGELELFLRLVRQSFVPPPEIRRLRDLTRLRKAQINERTRAIQRLEKVLQDAGIKLTSVASQAYSS